MLDEGGFEFAARFDQPVAACRRDLAGVHAPPCEYVVRMNRLDGRGPRRDRVARVVDGRERLPVDRELIVGEPVEGVVVSDQCRHRLAAVARDAGREHRLVLDVRIDAETVDARNIGGGEDAGEARITLVEGGEIAEREARMGVGGAHHPQPECAVRCGVCAEESAAGDLFDAVHAREAAAHVSPGAVVLRGGAHPHPAVTCGLHQARVSWIGIRQDRGEPGRAVQGSHPYNGRPRS